MPNWLKQSTTQTIKLGPFVSSADGVTAQTAASFTAYLSINGGAFGARNDATAIAHDRDGYYNVELNATDTGTTGRLRVEAVASSCLPVWMDFMVVVANTYDSLVSGSAKVNSDANLVSVLGTASAGAAGYVGVDWGQVANKTTANALTGTTISSSQVAASVTGNVGGDVVGNVQGAVGSVSAGVLLAAGGLDAITTTLPTHASLPFNFRQMMVMNYWVNYGNATKSASGGTIKRLAADNVTVITTQPYTDDGAGNETIGAAS